MSDYVFDWNDLAFADKKPIRQLKAIFILAPRELSTARFTQLVKEYLPKGNIVLGLAKEDYIEGFAGQPQFRALKSETVQLIIDKVNTSKTPHKIHTLRYFQRDVDAIIGKLNFSQAVLVNGSWLYTFHNRSTYYALINNHASFDMVSPFVSEQEAKEYLQTVNDEILGSLMLPTTSSSQLYNEQQMFHFADTMARRSFDYSFQTGVALGKKTIGNTVNKTENSFELLSYTYNKIVPYDTYALHFGASREKHFSPPNDLNHYDTVHGEIDIIITAQKQGLNLNGTTLFINLLPCPTCARALCLTDISEILYHEDHSDGYAVKILELAGKTVRRVV